MEHPLHNIDIRTFDHLEWNYKLQPACSFCLRPNPRIIRFKSECVVGGVSMTVVLTDMEPKLNWLLTPMPDARSTALLSFILKLKFKKFEKISKNPLLKIISLPSLNKMENETFRYYLLPDRGPVQMFYLEIESKSYHQGGVFLFITTEFESPSVINFIKFYRT